MKRKRIIRTGLTAALVGLILIQFFRPKKNISELVLQTDITNLYIVPDSVLNILERSCYDCHSNNTHYPWYSNVQPFAWWLNKHIKDGKHDINFSDFGSYTVKRRTSKLKSIANSIKDGSMPLKSYTLIHSRSILTDEEKKAIFRWLDDIQQKVN